MKHSVNSLLKLACEYADQDREAFIDCYDSPGFRDDPARLEAIEFLKQLRAYRLNRWGKSKLEQVMSECKSIPVLNILGEGLVEKRKYSKKEHHEQS